LFLLVIVIVIVIVPECMGILDTIIDTKRSGLVNEFEPLVTVGKILEQLKERDREILSRRYGLAGFQEQTLEAIGKDLKLTRERVRQIEKALLKHLQASSKQHAEVSKSRELLHGLLTEHGGIMAEVDLLEHLGVEAVEEANAVRFLLQLLEEVENIRGHEHIRDAWAALQFDTALFNKFVAEAKAVLEDAARPHGGEHFLQSFKQTEFYKQYPDRLSDKVILNFLSAAKHISRNAFGEYGLAHWRDITPRDVGDKAYLVLKHHGKPEHYSQITELINKHHPGSRRAYKETTHNELIKDKRFVLVGRGIYALAEWGYKPGVVADVIAEVLLEAGKPLTRDEIIEQVLKRRMVKKNTILVGLSNKKRFTKVGKNQYQLVTM
jgi:hypothetical protein